MRASPHQTALCLIICLFLSVARNGADAFSTPMMAITPPVLGIGALLFPPSVEIEPSRGNDASLKDAADFFTDAFWAAKLNQKELSERQRSSLLASQRMEFKRRYGGRRKQSAELLVTRNSKSGTVIGCAGFEVDQIPVQSDGTYANNNVIFAPLLSNVAVSRSVRRRGIAQKLVVKAEEVALRQWGYDSMYLYVEERNTAAVKLYRKMGYKTMWKDPTASSLWPTPNGSMSSRPTTLVCMKKVLGKKGGILGLFSF